MAVIKVPTQHIGRAFIKAGLVKVITNTSMVHNDHNGNDHDMFTHWMTYYIENNLPMSPSLQAVGIRGKRMRRENYAV